MVSRRSLGPVGVTAPWGNGPQAAGEPRVVELAARVQPDGPFELHAGDRVLFVGGTLVERAQRFGYVEAALTAAFPDRDVIFRNLGWSGDTVWGEARARFGTAADGFEHLETHVYAERPTLIFVAYGGNEAFAGAAGLDTFVTGLNQLLDVLSTTGATLVLMTPVAQENLGPPLPDPHPARIGTWRSTPRRSRRRPANADAGALTCFASCPPGLAAAAKPGR